MLIFLNPPVGGSKLRPGAGLAEVDADWIRLDQMTMKAFAVAVLGLAVFGAASQASASASAASAGGVSLMSPAVARDSAGTRVEGAVCRTGPVSVAGLEAVTIEQLGADGAVLAQTRATVPASLRVRGPKCAYYHVQTAWTASAPVQVCLTATGGQKVCAQAR